MKSTENPWKSHEIFTRFPRKKKAPPGSAPPPGAPCRKQQVGQQEVTQKVDLEVHLLRTQKSPETSCVLLFKNLQFIHFPTPMFIFLSLIRAVCSFTRIYLYIYLLYIYMWIFFSLCGLLIYIVHMKKEHGSLPVSQGLCYLGNGLLPLFCRHSCEPTSIEIEMVLNLRFSRQTATGCAAHPCLQLDHNVYTSIYFILFLFIGISTYMTYISIDMCTIIYKRGSWYTSHLTVDSPCWDSKCRFVWKRDTPICHGWIDPIYI